ncbi:MAG: RDD family protein [Myxococcaceae bacterium]|nr:RDD family protein [Myxococcaceae bacterium]
MAASADSHLEGTHTVVTPESVEFDFALAGLYSRFLAWLLDGLIVVAVYGAVMTALATLLAFTPGLVSAFSFILFFLLDWGYGMALEALWSGQTVGKRVMGLRVIQESGVRIGVYQALLRNLARPLDRLPLLYGVGGLAALFSEKHQRFGDLLAGTLVVRERRLKLPEALTRPEGGAALLADVQFVQRVSRLSTEERELTVAAVLRRDDLAMDARLTLFGRLCARLQEALGLERPAHLSDEKWCLLVAAALVRSEQARSGAPGLGLRSITGAP